ncbi:uncharacterized sporulation protein YeaH/YhbH (DUF444 family) [Methylobacterium sp. RAS18]|nr:uncharacterized sporulation protein YeaH/YhbH (DUF444 family) [Methylobacterium sp. RAS18]
MTEAHRQRMDTTIRAIVEQEGEARELAELAHRLMQDGHSATARLLRAMSRRLRVKGMELRGDLAVLTTGDPEALRDCE